MIKELIQYWNLESTMIKSRIEDTYKLYNMDAVSVGFLKKKICWGGGGCTLVLKTTTSKTIS